MRTLLLGAGSSTDKRIFTGDKDHFEGKVVRLDFVRSHKPDVVFDLNGIGKRIWWCPWRRRKLPFPDGWFDEIHAYEVLEHVGKQGDAEGMFREFTEYWRVLRNGGLMCVTVPMWDSIWAWGDPSHTRVITRGTLTFLNQKAYGGDDGVGKTAMSDFRHIWHKSFELIWFDESKGSFKFVLQKE